MEFRGTCLITAAYRFWKKKQPLAPPKKAIKKEPQERAKDFKNS